MSLAMHVMLLTLLTLLTSALSNPDRNPDCRKFVFAPICRGVAAKRSHQLSQNVKSSLPLPLRNGGYLLDANKLKQLVKSFAVAADWIGDDDVTGNAANEVAPLANYDYDHPQPL